MRISKKKISAVLCAFAIVLWFAAGLLAHVNIAHAEEQTGSLTLWCVKDDDIVSNMHWQIYRVGHRSSNDYVFDGDFAGYRATLGDKSKPMLEWDTKTVAAAGDALKFKTIVDEIPFLDEGKTNEQGSVTFDGLTDGLYLVWGDTLRVGNTTYVPSAIFFEMRGEDAAVLNAYPKIVLYTLGEEDVNYSVRKVWQNDENQPWNRAASIIVERYRDNVYYDTITLSDANDWTFAWTDEAGHEWFTYEKVIPPHYSVAYEDNHKQYLIVNTFDDTTDDDSSTDRQTTSTNDDDGTDRNTTTSTDSTTTTQTSVTDGNQTSDTNVTTSGATTAGNTTETTVQTSRQTTKQTTRQSNSTTARTVTTTTVTQEKAPQTGQLWWPVPILAVGGVILLGFGMHLTKKDDSE